MDLGYILDPIKWLLPIHESAGTQTVDRVIRSDMLSQRPQSERFPKQPGRDEYGALHVTRFEQLQQIRVFLGSVAKKSSK